MNGKREYDLRDQERREQAANVRVGALCRVEKFDPAAMRVDVQPLSKALDAGVYRTQVALLAEGVDRNHLHHSVWQGRGWSPSSRRAWIEIRLTPATRTLAAGRPPRGGRG